MKPLPGESIVFESFFIFFFISIDLVSYDRISYGCKMDADLMSASSQKINLKKCVFISNNSSIAKLCFSNFWIVWIDSCHFLSIVRVPPDE